MIDPMFILVFAGGFVTGMVAFMYLTYNEVVEAEEILEKQRKELQNFTISSGGYNRW